MKKTLLTTLICLMATFAYSDTIFIEGFEYANHDETIPVGWVCDDNSWLCGYLEKDHNRIPHSGNWYAYTDAEDSWMFMEQYFSTALRYRPSFWVISDGVYDVEFWTGNEATPEGMTNLLFSATVSSGTYEKLTEYVESLSSNYQFFGIHAVAHEGAYRLTIDDVIIDMVEKYSIDVNPMRFDTVMMPGSRITIEYDVQNTGYEDLDICMTPITEFFTDFEFTYDGAPYSMHTYFPAVSNQVVHCTLSTTLLPTIEIGTLCWVDIMFTVSCDCVTTMATLWATAGDPTTAVPEVDDDEEVQRVEWYDLTGRQVDPANLKAGIYIEKTYTEKGVSTRKVLHR